MEKDITTEEKIKEAARKVFQQKGYAGARTRDIAEEAGINLALLNYYYRSKEKLFELVLDESILEISKSLRILLNDDSPLFGGKIDMIVDKYIDVVSTNPSLPLFVLGEIQANPQKFQKKLGIPEAFISNSHLYKQIHEQLKSVGMQEINPMHIIINIISMTIFPFVGKPLIKNVSGMDEPEFNRFIEERRKFIPMWLKMMLKLN